MTYSLALQVLVLCLSVAAAVLALISALIPIRDSIDDFMDDLHRQGFWVKLAASANLVASSLLIAVQVLR